MSEVDMGWRGVCLDSARSLWEWEGGAFLMGLVHGFSPPYFEYERYYDEIQEDRKMGFLFL